MNARIEILVTFLSIVLAACATVADVQYHPVCGSPPCTVDQLSQAVPQRDFLVERHGWKTSMTGDVSNWRRVPYFQAWMEYSGKNNQLFDPEQKRAVLSRLNAFSSDRQPVYIVVYVHGWHNNADDSLSATGTNARSFPDLMGRFVDELERKSILGGQGAMPHVLGIYIGWQGESVRSRGIFRVLSIEDRAKAADQLGAGPPDSPKSGLRADLKEISAAARAVAPGSKMIVLGHSLGGRVLTAAFLDEFTKLGTAGAPRQPLGAGTAIVTLNAAVGADCFGAIYRRQMEPEFTVPTWINVTSTDDSATGSAYPLAKVLGLAPSCVSGSPAASSVLGHYAPFVTQSMLFTHITDWESKGTETDHGRSPCVRYTSAKQPLLATGSFDFAYTLEQHAILVYPFIAQGRELKYDRCSVGVYSASLIPAKRASFPRQFWNVQTDRNTIDFAEDGGTTRSLHSGIISTNLTRMLVDLSYSVP